MAMPSGSYHSDNNVIANDNCDSEPSTSEDETRPAFKRTKYTGASKYRTKFKSFWKKEFNWITSVPGDPYK
jgi:hypothetical protein